MTRRLFAPLLALAMVPCSLAARAEQRTAEAPRISAAESIEYANESFGGTLRRRITGDGRTRLFARPYAVAWQGDSLLVTDPDAGTVTRLDARRNATRARSEALEPLGIAVCGASIFVTDASGGRVERLDSSLRHVGWLATGLQRPTGIACAGELVAVAETAAHRIALIDAEGRIEYLGARGVDAGGLNFPVSLDVRGERLWIADTMNFRIVGLDLRSRTFDAQWGRLGRDSGDMPRIKGIASDSDGNVWVADAMLDEVTIYSPAGSFLSSFGSPGIEPGQFSFPAGLAFSAEGRLAVVDSLNRRVQVFKIERGGAK